MPEEDQEQIIQNDGPSFEFEEEGDPQRRLTIDELYDHAGFKLTSFNNSLASGVALFMFGVLIMYVQLVSQYMLCKEEMTDVEVVAMKIIAILGFIIGKNDFGKILLFPIVLESTWKANRFHLESLKHKRIIDVGLFHN